MLCVAGFDSFLAKNSRETCPKLPTASVICTVLRRISGNCFFLICTVSSRFSALPPGRRFLHEGGSDFGEILLRNLHGFESVSRPIYPVQLLAAWRQSCPDSYPLQPNAILPDSMPKAQGSFWVMYDRFDTSQKQLYAMDACPKHLPRWSRAPCRSALFSLTPDRLCQIEQFWKYIRPLAIRCQIARNRPLCPAHRIPPSGVSRKFRQF